MLSPTDRAPQQSSKHDRRELSVFIFFSLSFLRFEINIFNSVGMAKEFSGTMSLWLIVVDF